MTGPRPNSICLTSADITKLLQAPITVARTVAATPKEYENAFLPEQNIPHTFGEVGGLLWVRETWRVTTSLSDVNTYGKPAPALVVKYFDGVERTCVAPDVATRNKLFKAHAGKTLPPRTMGQWMSRYWVQLVELQMQRIQSFIPESEAWEVWDRLYRKHIYYKKNPWAWRLVLKLHQE